MDLNIRPGFIKEVSQACAAVRLCHAYNDKNRKNRTAFDTAMGDCMLKIGMYTDTASRRWKEEYNIVFGDALVRFNNCYLWSPDVRYVLFAFKFFRDLMSG
ncbi:uncharacterized protein LOC144134720 [Amblyomma americanum]